MTTLFDVLDLSALAGAVRLNAPALTSCFVVGSAISRPKHLVQDIDITGFAPHVGLGEDQSYSFDFDGLPVHVVSYHPTYFDAMASDQTLTLLFLREIRKLRRGAMLFDLDGQGAALQSRMQHVEMPIDLLEEQFLVVADGEVRINEPDGANYVLRQRLNLYYLVENALFYFLHLNANFMYSKPKWIALDIAQTGSAPMIELVDAISAEYVSAGIVSDAVDRAQAAVAQLSQDPDVPAALHAHAAAMTKDAAQLARSGDYATASWPLRMAVLMMARCISVARGRPYEDCRSLQHLMPILRRHYLDFATLARLSTLADVPLNRAIVDLWGQAKDELSHRRETAIRAKIGRKKSQRTD